ncbi:hypothetical protein HPB47_005332 [Ixodes persulcatus]|uniref:Uncharacterized protein n=1 Tax=Ixodes persulcatus TaxID=34615 RepID=A0AC60PE51_IXOPE|nr:hypothetical protein HPB47_005332 [Ixodes persulcatus]
MDSQLRCRYYTGESGFFKLQPIKLEEFNLKPYIVVLRDILQDRDLNDMMDFAKPRNCAFVWYTSKHGMAHIHTPQSLHQ